MRMLIMKRFANEEIDVYQVASAVAGLSGNPVLMNQAHSLCCTSAAGGLLWCDHFKCNWVKPVLLKDILILLNLVCCGGV